MQAPSRGGSSGRPAALVGVAEPQSGGLASYTANTTFDALDRLRTMSFDEVQAPAATTFTSATFTHAYDAIDRRIGQTTTDDGFWDVPSAGATVTYTANDLDQYTAVEAATPTYDGNGNLADDDTFAYDYDSRNRLIAVANSGGGATVATYSYDARSARKTATAGGATTVFVADADDRVVLTYNGSTGALQKRLLYGLGIDDAVMVIDAQTGNRDSLIPDIQGSVIGSLASASATLTKIGYRPFGESATATPGIRYTGRRLDALTGLYHYRARAYNSAWGRFLQPDPIGLGGGSNLYAYVGNDPLNFVDPFGLESQPGGGSQILSDADPHPIRPGTQYAQAALGLCAAGPAGCVVGGGITAGQIILGGAAVAGATGTGAVILNQTQSGADSPTNSSPRVPVYRVVDPTELAHLQATGNYGANPSQSGKYFALSPGGAQAFATAPMNAGSTITSTTLPQSVVNQGFPVHDPGPTGAGPSVFFGQPQLPMVYESMTPPVILPREQ